MRVAIKGFEAEFEAFTAKKITLTEEKETAKAEACAQVDADFAEREAILDEVLEKISVEEPDPIPEPEVITSELVEDSGVTSDQMSFPHITV